MAKEKKEDENTDIDFGIGKFSIGGLFNGLEKLVDLASKLKEAGGEINKEGEFDLSNLKEGMKGVYGFSIKTAGPGGSGKPVVESFGNIKKTPKGPKVEEEREPIIDIFDEKEEIKVYAEMPGVNTEDIKLDLKGDILDISAKTGDRKYHKEILLPARAGQGFSLADNAGLVACPTFTYNNGILVIKIKK